MRTPARIATVVLLAVLAVLVACLGLLAESPTATGTGLPELPESELFSPPGHLTRLHAGVTYQASKVPLALRLTPSDGSWSGAQWKAGKFGDYEIKRRHLRCPAACAGPFFGWAAVGQGNPKRPPTGLLLVMTAYARTPSVAATVENLRTRGHGVTYEEAVPIKLSRFSGIQLDGKVVAAKTHFFVPFSPPGHLAPDAIEVDEEGLAFRFIVLNVHGKTAVLFLAADQFPSIVTKADGILKSLRFPGG